MRRRFALIWLGATALVSAVVGGLAYQAGWSAGIAAHMPAGAPAYYYGPHFFGFGFGLLPLLFIVLVLALIFRGGRRWGTWSWGGRGWAGGPRGYYGDPRSPYGGGPGPSTPPGPPPPSGDPMADWPQRPPSQPGPSGPQQV